MIQSIVLGIVQGITEFLPISSSGHLIIARSLLHLPLENSLGFDVFLNTATLLAVIYCFWGDIRRIFVDLFTEGPSSRSTNLIYSLVVGTIPAALVGYFYGEKLENAFRNPHAVAYALIVGSIIMFLADRVQSRGGINPTKGLIVGLFQTLALIPGISRSGASISGGLFSKLSREEAIKFSFLLYIPISLGALLKISMGGLTGIFTLANILGFLAALFTGIWALRFLVRFLSNHSFNIFIIYRVLIAILVLFFLR